MNITPKLYCLYQYFFEGENFLAIGIAHVVSRTDKNAVKFFQDNADNALRPDKATSWRGNVVQVNYWHHLAMMLLPNVHFMDDKSKQIATIYSKNH